MSKSYYGILMKNGTELTHYGVKGMKWGKHLFGLARLKKGMINTMETDTGTRTNGLPNDSGSIIQRIQAQRAAKTKASQEAATRRIAEMDQLRAQAEAEKAAKKKKKSGSGGKKSSSKSSDKKEENKESKETEESKDKEAIKKKYKSVKQPKGSLPDDLVERIQDNRYKMTPSEIKLRVSNGVKMAKEIVKFLPKNPTEEDILDLLYLESDKRGIGYDRFALNIALDSAFISYFKKQIATLEAKGDNGDALKRAKEELALNQKLLKASLKNGDEEW